MDSQKSYFVGQLRSLVAPTRSSAAFPSSEETASHPDWLRTFTIFPNSAETTSALHRSNTKGDYGTDCESLMVRSPPQTLKAN